MVIEFDEERMDYLAEKFQSPLQHANNQDYSGNVGGHAYLDFNIGMGAMIGVMADADLSYTYEVSHRLLKGEDTESSTSITVELGDSEVGDEFLVDFRLDRK